MRATIISYALLYERNISSDLNGIQNIFCIAKFTRIHSTFNQPRYIFPQIRFALHPTALPIVLNSSHWHRYIETTSFLCKFPPQKTHQTPPKKPTSSLSPRHLPPATAPASFRQTKIRPRPNLYCTCATATTTQNIQLLTRCSLAPLYLFAKTLKKPTPVARNLIRFVFCTRAFFTPGKQKTSGRVARLLFYASGRVWFVHEEWALCFMRSAAVECWDSWLRRVRWRRGESFVS